MNGARPGPAHSGPLRAGKLHFGTSSTTVTVLTGSCCRAELEEGDSRVQPRAASLLVVLVCSLSDSLPVRPGARDNTQAEGQHADARNPEYLTSARP